MFHVRESRLLLPGVQMDYISFGRGAKSMIMIQGLNTNGIRGSGLMLSFMYRLFAKDYTVYLFDRRADVPDGITVRDLAADVALAMDALNLSGADVLGVSQGGMIAQYLAIDRPDLVHKLVLAVTLSRSNATLTQAIDAWIRLTLQGDMKALVADMAARMYSAAYVRRYRPFMPLLAIVQKPKDVQRFITLAKATLTCSAYDELDKIHCPVLVIGGMLDQVTSAIASREIAEKLGCPIHMYSDLGHTAYEDKAFNQRVLAFFKG